MCFFCVVLPFSFCFFSEGSRSFVRFGQRGCGSAGTYSRRLDGVPVSGLGFPFFRVVFFFLVPTTLRLFFDGGRIVFLSGRVT